MKKTFFFVLLAFTFFSFDLQADDVTVGDGENPLGLYRYRGHDITPRGGLIYYYDQLREPRTYNWGNGENIGDRFPVISVSSNGKPCHFHSDKGCEKMLIPPGSTLYETFVYIGSDVQGVHHYEGILQILSPRGEVIRHRRTQCNSLPSTSANVGCPFEVPDVNPIIET